MEQITQIKEISKELGNRSFKLQFSINILDGNHGSHGLTSVIITQCTSATDAKAILLTYIDETMYPDNKTNTFIYNCEEVTPRS